MADGASGLTSVDIQGMAEMLPIFEQALSETQLAYSRMETQRHTLTGSWTGDAANIFESVLDEWLTQLNEVQQQLKWVTDTFQANTQGYARVHSSTLEEANQVKRKVGAGLPGF